MGLWERLIAFLFHTTEKEGEFCDASEHLMSQKILADSCTRFVNLLEENEISLTVRCISGLNFSKGNRRLSLLAAEDVNHKLCLLVSNGTSFEKKEAGVKSFFKPLHVKMNDGELRIDDFILRSKRIPHGNNFICALVIDNVNFFVT